MQKWEKEYIEEMFKRCKVDKPVVITMPKDLGKTTNNKSLERRTK